MKKIKKKLKKIYIFHSFYKNVIRPIFALRFTFFYTSIWLDRPKCQKKPHESIFALCIDYLRSL